MGREDDLAAVDALLRASDRVNIAAAVGMGGVGKTELALQYALRRGNAFAGGVCWLRDTEPVASQMIAFAQTHLGLTVPEQVEKPLMWCAQRWPGSEDDKVLLVVDDVQDYGLLRERLPNSGVGGGRFRVLLTTREAILPEGQRLALEVLMPEAALELLTALAPKQVEAEPEQAKDLCERVGRLPLGIELVGWHLHRRPELTIAKLLSRLEEKKLAARALMKRHPEMTAKLGVAAAFEVSWEPLSEEAKRLAGLLGLFAAAPMKWAWVQQAYEQAEAAFDEEVLEEAQAELLRVNLLQKIEGEGRYRVHPLVREFFAVKLSELAEAEALQLGFAQAMTAVAKMIPQAVTVTVRAQVTDAVPHMEEVAQRWTAMLADDNKIWCCRGLGRFYKALSQWTDAEQCYLKAIQIGQAEPGTYYSNKAIGLNDLAVLYKNQGLYNKAEPLYQQALDIRRATLKANHPHIALSLSNLAVIYRIQGRYSESEVLCRESLEIYNSQPNSSLESARVLSNFAKLREAQELYSEAEALYEQAVDIYKTELGDANLQSIRVLSNMSILYVKKGDYSKAESLQLEVFKFRLSELGERHPEVALSIHNLAGIHKQQNQFDKAESLYKQALEIREDKLGKYHIQTSYTLRNLALLYRDTNRPSLALSMLAKALTIRENTFGSEHRRTLPVKEELKDLQKRLKEDNAVQNISTSQN